MLFRSDEDVPSDDALGTDPGACPNLGPVPDAGAGPDGNVGLEISGWMDVRSRIDHEGLTRLQVRAEARPWAAQRPSDRPATKPGRGLGV